MSKQTVLTSFSEYFKETWALYAALWQVTLTLLNLLRHWPFTYLSKLMQFVLFKASVICSLVSEHAMYSVYEKEILGLKKTYLVTPTNLNITGISGE
jgi:hypothetical protein